MKLNKILLENIHDFVFVVHRKNRKILTINHAAKVFFNNKSQQQLNQKFTAENQKNRYLFFFKKKNELCRIIFHYHPIDEEQGVWIGNRENIEFKTSLKKDLDHLIKNRFTHDEFLTQMLLVLQTIIKKNNILGIHFVLFNKHYKVLQNHLISRNKVLDYGENTENFSALRSMTRMDFGTIPLTDNNFFSSMANADLSLLNSETPLAKTVTYYVNFNNNNDQMVFIFYFHDKNELLKLKMLEAFFDSFFPYFIYFEALSGIEQTQQAKSDFISILSHELRTPLNGILGYAQILMQTIKQKENHECLSYILQSGQRLLKIFENLILFQELRLKNYRLVNDNFSLIDIKRRIEFEFEAKVSEKNNQLQFLIQEDTPLICKGDAFLLLTVLINLVDNANKFTQNGQIHILLNFHMEKNAINFHINDTGCGFPEDKIEQVGKDFQQIETAMTRNYEGLGIGLSLVKEILKIVEGDLIIESKVSSGTKIKVLFPIQECEFHIV